MSFSGRMSSTAAITRRSVKQQIGSEAVVEGVAADKFAIGYSGIGYKTAGVRAVPWRHIAGDECYDDIGEKWCAPANTRSLAISKFI